MKFLLLILFIFFLLPFNLNAQAPGAPVVNINSGDPNYPFPQFLEYGNGHSLAKYNAEGIPHAEMEQTIRDAWQIMMNRSRYTGYTYTDPITGKSVKYMNFNNNSVPDNYGTFVSEGDGYVLLAAAYMGDKTSFDALWMWVHDNRLSKVKKYKDCIDLRPTYTYGSWLAGWQCLEASGAGGTDVNSATDGDVDIGLALLVAYRQWGEFMGINDACGNPISYKEAATQYIRAMADTVFATCGNGSTNPRQDPSGCNGYLTGDIGLDGYTKSGNTWGDMTNWAGGGIGYTYKGYKIYPKTSTMTIGSKFVDYMAPAYYHVFADFLTSIDPVKYDWCISQYHRAEAAADWVIGQLKTQGKIAYAGTYGVSGSTVSFSTFVAGEDFRLPVRTLLNYMWNGTPTATWDPTTHQTTNAVNTYEYNAAKDIASFLKHPKNKCESLGSDPTGGKIKYDGPAVLRQTYGPDGTPETNYYTNWTSGSSASAAVIEQDPDLIGQLWRQIEIEWDASNQNPANDFERYLGSTPKYFHEFFRVYGLLVLSGNLHSPNNIKASANLKCYMDIDKTYGFRNDLVTFNVSYRNYGKLDATNALLTFTLPSCFDFVSCQGGGTYNSASKTVTWNLGTVKGFKTSTGISVTKDSFNVVTKVIADTGHYCPVSNISCSNGSGWTSNEYPNKISSTMKRNCFDIVNRALYISKSVDKDKINPGDPLNFTVKFENSTKAGWLNGGRSGVRFTFGIQNTGTPSSQMAMYLYFRLLHAAYEPYINYGNYRLSYYLNDAGVSGVSPGLGQPGWMLEPFVYEGGLAKDISFATQNIPYGSNTKGNWNQRVIIKFADQLAAPVAHLYNQFGNAFRVHKGTVQPLKVWLSLKNGMSTNMNWTDDWSYDANYTVTGDKDIFWPITPDWSSPLGDSVPVNKWHKDECNVSSKVVEKILVEEYDGYGWRRVAGTGPMPGREATNVEVIDTLPADLVFDQITQQPDRGTVTYNAATRIIKWSSPFLLVGEKLNFSYRAYAKNETQLGGCPINKDVVNRSYIRATGESAVYSETKTNITCDKIPVVPPKTTMTKTADKTAYSVGDNITYMIKYKQTHGAHIIENMTSKTNWLDGSGYGLPQDFSHLTTPWTNPKFFFNKYSHGTNGELKFTIKVTNGWNNFSLIFRYVSGKPGQGNFDGIALECWPGKSGLGAGVILKAFNGNTLIGGNETTLLPYPLPSDVMTFIITLSNDTMKVWLNKSKNNAPLATFTGLKVQAGYVGFLDGKVDNGGGGDNGDHILQLWDSYFNSAFNVKFVDPLPSGITFTSASNSGTKDASDSIRWTVNAGPMLYNDSVSVTWTGKVTSCSGTKILNTVFANMTGQTSNSIGASVQSDCGNSTCVTPATAQITMNPAGGTVCSGNNVNLTGTATPAGTWKFKFYRNGSTAQAFSTNNTYSTNQSGSYYVTIYDASDSTCKKSSSPVTVTSNPLPVVTITPVSPQLCSGDSLLLTAGGATTYVWNSGGKTGTSIYVKPAIITTYTVTGTNSTTGCTAMQTVKVSVGSLPTATLTGGGNTCDSVALSVALTGTAPWKLKLNNGSSTWTVNNINTSPYTFWAKQTGTFKVDSVTTGCRAAGTGASIVSVNIKPTAAVSGGGNVCAGDSIPVSIKLTGTAPFKLKLSNGITKLTVSGIPVTNYIYYAKLTGTYSIDSIWDAKCSNKGTGSAVVTVSAKPTAVIGSGGSFCQGDSLALKVTLTGTSPIKLKLNNGLTTLKVSGVSAGIYTFYTKLPGIFSVDSITDIYCSNKGSGSSTVTMNPLPMANAGLDDRVCKDSSFRLNGQGAGIGGSYHWSSTGKIDNPNISNPLVSIDNSSIITDKLIPYILEVTDSKGCKDKDTLNITYELNCGPKVRAVATPNPICSGSNVSLSATVHDGQGPYIASSFKWSEARLNGQGPFTLSPLSSQRYTVTVTDALGRTDTNTVIIIVNPLPVVTISSEQSVCVGQSVTITAGGGSSYIWNNSKTTSAIIETPLIPTTYIVTVTDQSCSVTASTKVTVNALPTLLVSKDTTICKGMNVTLTASGTGAYTWSQHGETTSAITVNTLINTTYTVTLTDVNLCRSQKSIVVGIKDSLIPQITGLTSMCSGDSTQLTAVIAQPVSYLWNTGSTQQSLNTHQLFSDTHYNLTVTASDGCTGQTATAVTVHSLPVAEAGKDSSVCEGQSILLNANGGGSYLWSTGNTQQSIIVKPNTAHKVYSVTVTDSYGCSAKDTVNINMVSNPSVTAGPDTSVCAGSSVTLTATGTDNLYLWNTGATSSSIQVSPVSSTDYSVVMFNLNHCSDTAFVHIDAIAAPAIPVIKPQLVCSKEPKDVVLKVENPEAQCIYSWYADEFGGTVIQSGTSFTIPHVTSGVTMYVEAKQNVQGCKSITRGKAEISIGTLPQAEFNYAPDKIMEMTRVEFTNRSVSNVASEKLDYMWWFGLHQGTSTEKDPKHVYRDSGIYVVTLIVKNDIGCRDTLSKTLMVTKRMLPWLPLAFSPNEDGVNDRLYVRGPIKTMHFEIYNVWGYKIFESDEQVNGWDGKYKDIVQPEGLYVWKLNAVMLDDTDFIEQGILSLVR